MGCCYGTKGEPLVHLSLFVSPFCFRVPVAFHTDVCRQHSISSFGWGGACGLGYSLKGARGGEGEGSVTWMWRRQLILAQFFTCGGFKFHKFCERVEPRVLNAYFFLNIVAICSTKRTKNLSENPRARPLLRLCRPLRCPRPGGVILALSPFYCGDSSGSYASDQVAIQIAVLARRPAQVRIWAGGQIQLL